MKKITSLVLCFLMIAAVFLSIPVTASSDSEMTNVAVDCSYTCTPAPYTTDASKYTDNYRNKNFTELTDGQYGNSAGGSEWYALTASTTEIVVDLGKVQSSIGTLSAEFGYQESWGIQLPASVGFSGSTDGTSYTELGNATGTKETASEGARYMYSLTVSSKPSFRYIKMTVKKASGFCMMLSEIEVWTGFISSFSLGYNITGVIDGDYIKGFSSGLTYDDLVAAINSMDGVTITDANGTAITSGLIATGTKVTKTTDEETQEYIVVIDGDVNCDGVVNAKDYIMLKRHILGTYALSENGLLAADVSGDNAIKATDYLQVKRYVLGTYDIYAKYPLIEDPEVIAARANGGRGDVTSEYSDLDTTDNIEIYSSYDMTIKHDSSTLYTVTCSIYGGTLTLTIRQTAWTTWCLGAWKFTESNVTHTFIEGSTDWEYVYRAAQTATSTWVWSGGNHGNEQCDAITFYDATTGKAISPAIGETVQINGLKIVEDTTLFYDPTGTEAPYNFDSQYAYANTTRTYTIYGPQIKLDVDYTYTKDCYYVQSYSCMFPIEKKYGLYCAFIDSNNDLISVIETKKVGASDYSGKTYSGYAAYRTVLWGYGDEAKYKFDVRVLTPETSSNNFQDPAKTMFWDMNTGTNKVYFSKYPAVTSTRAVEKAGTKMTQSCMWTFFE